MKEIKDNANIWRDIPCSWIESMDILKITTKSIYKFNAICIKLPMKIFTELEQILSQFLWKCEKSQIAKGILRKKNGAGGIKLSDFRLYYKTTIIRTVWYWNKSRIKSNRTR